MQAQEINEQRIQLEAMMLPQTKAGKLAAELRQFMAAMEESDRKKQ